MVLQASSLSSWPMTRMLFAQSPSGEARADWLFPDLVYHFRLYSRTQKLDGPLREISVHMEPAPPVQKQPAPPRAEPAPPAQTEPKPLRPYIRATPNPIPDSPGPDLGSTSIEWSTGDGSNGWIYLLTAGRQEVLFASGPYGTRPAPVDSAQSCLPLHAVRRRRPHAKARIRDRDQGEPATWSWRSISRWGRRGCTPWPPPSVVAALTVKRFARRSASVTRHRLL